MEAEPPKADPPKRKRRWFQFSLRTLMIVVVVLSAGCAYVKYLLARYEAEWREEDAAIAKISAMMEHQVGGEIAVGRVSHGPTWLQALVPSDRQWIFDRVESVGLDMNFATDRDDTEKLIGELKKFKFLENVSEGGLLSGSGHARVDFKAVGSALHISISEPLDLVGP